MIGLIIKDFTIQKKALIKYFIASLLFMFVFAFALEQQVLMALAMFPVIYGYINRSLYEDEKNNTLRLLLSLPLEKNDIVFAKYISTGIMITVITMIFSVYSKLLVLNGIWHAENMVASTTIATMILIFVILISTYLPFVYKLGYIRASGIYRFIFMVIFALAISFSVIAQKMFDSWDIPLVIKAMKFLMLLSPVYLNAIIFIFIILIYLISMKLSSILFNKRNLF